MRQVLSARGGRRFPTWKQWQQLPRLLSRGEKAALLGCLAVFVLSLGALGFRYASTHQVAVPAEGGSYVEALVGEPQFVNPIYATQSDVDADLTRLVFSGLLRWDPVDGYVNDLAANVDVSADGKTYTVTMRDDARFHDGSPVRANDVVYTVTSIEDPAYRSPLASDFQGVAVSQTDDRTVVFTLDKPSSGFRTRLTFGILPSALWTDIPARNVPLASRNLEPVGSGPYKFKEFAKDAKGNILSYTLTRNADYYGTKALIDTLTFKFYPDARSAVSALDNRNVEGAAVIPPESEADLASNRAVALLRPSMPRETTLFFNPAKSDLLKNADVRHAIAMAVDKPAVLQAAVNGHGSVLTGPIPAGDPGYASDVQAPGFDPAGANALLDKAGFKKADGSAYRSLPKDSTNAPVSVIMTTVQEPEFVRAAQVIVTDLQAIGIKATVNAVSPDDLFGSVIQPRAYEMLLSATLLGADEDPAPFWLSSQATGNGLNLASYASKKADAALEAAEVALSADDRAAKLHDFQAEVANDVPAVFLYQSTYTYALSSKIKGADIERIGTPDDRFARVTDWYLKTKNVLR
jgi:peptide/nickel transport system substrate-binding protein